MTDLTNDYATIRVLGKALDDLQRQRIAIGNRIGAAERTLGEALPRLYVIKEGIEALEDGAAKELERAFRKHPLAPWVKSVRGAGAVNVARLIAEIGDPTFGSHGHWEENGRRVWVIDDYYERTPAQLWAYCGVGDPKHSKIPKNATQEDIFRRGKPIARKQLHLISTSMLKARNREVYDARRAETEGRLHEDACKPCHAKTGDPWRDGHAHADALRIVSKEFLRELWAASRLLHGLEADVHPGRWGKIR
jgi:hypothetical protein